MRQKKVNVIMKRPENQQHQQPRMSQFPAKHHTAWTLSNSLPVQDRSLPFLMRDSLNNKWFWHVFKAITGPVYYIFVIFISAGARILSLTCGLKPYSAMVLSHSKEEKHNMTWYHTNSHTYTLIPYTSDLSTHYNFISSH